MKQIIQTKEAPEAIGPYSQGVKANGFLFLSGQIALAANGEHKINQGIAEQTQQVMQNMQALLGEAGLTFADVVKTTIFLENMEDFEAVNNVYGTYFMLVPPARSTVCVQALPKGAKVEIECIAVLND